MIGSSPIGSTKTNARLAQLVEHVLRKNINTFEQRRIQCSSVMSVANILLIKEH